MMSTWNFIQSNFEKSHDAKHNSYLSIYFRILDDMAVLDRKMLLVKNALKLKKNIYPKI